MSDASPPALIDRLRAVFADQYEIESEMPSGGMSRLFLARDTTLNRRVGIAQTW
ncbi:hypothetical protein BH23GEM1_BH23GEM1_03460 [soil metagenome]